MRVLSYFLTALPLLVLTACDGSRLGQGAEPTWHDSVPYQLGARDFEPGDAIEILSLEGSRPVLAPGEVYMVKGSYTLASRETADLLIGATVSLEPGEPPPRLPWSPATIRVERGFGFFEAPLYLPPTGKPHVTMYNVQTRRPFSGVYFGDGPSLLEVKTWAYE